MQNLTDLTDAYLQGMLKNEQGHIDYLNAQIEALQAQRDTHRRREQQLYAALRQRGKAPYRTWLVKVGYDRTEAKITVDVPASIARNGNAVTQTFIENTCKGIFGDRFEYVQTAYPIDE